MKLYISGRAFERDEVRQLMTTFETIGLKCTFDWTKYNETMELLNKEGINEADIFIAYMPDRTYDYKDVIKELEYAKKTQTMTFSYCPYFNDKNAKFYMNPILDDKSAFSLYYFVNKMELIKYISDMSSTKLTLTQKASVKTISHINARAFSR